MIRPVMFGKFVLLERVSVGGMAEVYRAKLANAPHFNRYLAIKRILPNLAADREFISMFINEAKITVELNHPNICQIYELGRLEDSHYIVMEFIPGHDVLAMQQRYRRQKKIMSVSQACFVTAQVAQGLDYAHRAVDASGNHLGIVHRDVSPQNILVSYEGLIKLIDFGVAKAASKNSKTQAGVLKGKFGYMSPEQVGAGGEVDHRSDIFALGTVFWELLTGRRLFFADNEFATLELVRECQIEPPSKLNRLVPPQIESICMRALCPDPNYRYQYAGEMVRDLWMFLNSCNPPYTQWHLQNWMCTHFAEDLQKEWEKLPVFQSINTADDVRNYNEAQVAKAHAEMRAQMLAVRDFEGNIVPELSDMTDEGGVRTTVFTPDYDFNQVQTDDEHQLPELPGVEGQEASSPEVHTFNETPPENPLMLSMYQMDAFEPVPPQPSRGGVVALAIVLVLLLIGGGAGGAYWWFVLRTPETKAETQEAKANVRVKVMPSHPDVSVKLKADDATTVLGTKPGSEVDFADLAPGRYFVEIAHPDFEIETRELALGSGDNTIRVDMLRKKLVMGTVRLTVTPDDAIVFVGPVEQEGTGAERVLSLEAGRLFDIRVVRPGYLPFETQVTPNAETETPLEVPLHKGVASVIVKSTPADATVFVMVKEEEWDKRGNTPFTLEGLDPTVPLTIEVRKRGYKNWRKEITFEDQFEKSFLATLVKE